MVAADVSKTDRSDPPPLHCTGPDHPSVMKKIKYRNAFDNVNTYKIPRSGVALPEYLILSLELRHRTAINLFG